jgi:hypothetical protein
MVVQACNPSTNEAVAEQLLSSRPAWLHSESLSQKNKTKGKIKRIFENRVEPQRSVGTPSNIPTYST